MVSTYRIERDRGTKEARQQLAVLREKWPLAFPVQAEDVRPLAMGVARQVAAAMGFASLHARSAWPLKNGDVSRYFGECDCGGVLQLRASSKPDGTTPNNSNHQTLIANANDLADERIDAVLKAQGNLSEAVKSFRRWVADQRVRTKTALAQVATALNEFRRWIADQLVCQSAANVSPGAACNVSPPCVRWDARLMPVFSGAFLVRC